MSDRTIAELERENAELRGRLFDAREDFEQMRRQLQEQHYHRTRQLEAMNEALMRHLSRMEATKVPQVVLVPRKARDERGNEVFADGWPAR